MKTPMKSAMEHTHDRDIQEDVEKALGWAPEVDSAKIGVAVGDGVVTLSGQVGSNWQKIMAGKTALRTRGVTALANEILVHHITDPRTDSDVALAAHNVLKWNADVPQDVKVDVEDHVVTLTGEVEWNHQRETARRLVEHLIGVKDVRNRITLKPRPNASAAETDAMIRRALIRNASVDAGRIHAAASGTRVVLTGVASSYAEKRQAELAAWASPHVDDVDNQIIVDFGP